LGFTGPLSARSFLALSREAAPKSEEEQTAMVEAISEGSILPLIITSATLLSSGCHRC
jgi:hypothetical protein